MKRLTFINRFVYTLLCSMLFLLCSQNPVEPEKEQSFFYNINVPKMGLDSLHIILRIRVGNLEDSIHLLIPPVYADNPFPVQTSSNVHNVKLSGTCGNTIPFTSDTVLIETYKHLSLSFPSIDTLFTFEYDVTFNYFDTLGRPLPFFNSDYGFIQGAYLFAIPFEKEDLTSIWRTEKNLSVHYTINSALNFYGDPLPQTNFNTPYELLFSTSAINADLLYEGEGGKQKFRFVYAAKKTADDSLLQKAYAQLEIILDDVTGIFGTLGNNYLTVILGVNKISAQEGTYAFNALDPTPNETKGWYGVILAHEAVHCWVGIRVGEYDDPWWKEGTTNYLGYLFALRNNLSTDFFITNMLCRDLSDDKWVRSLALSDPEVRSRIFAPIDDCGFLVYYKGAQVNMLLDRKIREGSSKTSSLDKVLGAFTNEFDGRAFRRQEYLTYIKSQTGVDVSDIFDIYVDAPGPIPVSVLKDNSAALIDMGAFGDSVVVNITDMKDNVIEGSPMKYY